MIERRFVAEKLKEFRIEEFVSSSLGRVGHSKTKMVRTPLGEKIVVYTFRPGLVVGRKGANIKKLTKDLKNQFNLENPQVEISEVENPNLDPRIVAESISMSLERLGSSKFKGICHKMMSNVMGVGALGVEIVISGKIPSSRARRWRFYQGYLKKCGDIARVGVLSAYTIAQLKTGIVGIQVRIMPSDLRLPDDIKLVSEMQEVVEETDMESKEKKENKEEKEAKEKNAKLKEKKSETDNAETKEGELKGE